jgi:hypothetical protein
MDTIGGHNVKCVSQAQKDKGHMFSFISRQQNNKNKSKIMKMSHTKGRSLMGEGGQKKKLRR